MTRQLRTMMMMVLLLLAVPGAALAAEGGATQSANMELLDEEHVDAGTAPASFSAGLSKEALSFSMSSGPALVVLGGFLGWLSRRRVARRGAWCRSHG